MMSTERVCQCGSTVVTLGGVGQSGPDLVTRCLQRMANWVSCRVSKLGADPELRIILSLPAVRCSHSSRRRKHSKRDQPHQRIQIYASALMADSGFNPRRDQVWNVRCQDLSMSRLAQAFKVSEYDLSTQHSNPLPCATRVYSQADTGIS